MESLHKKMVQELDEIISSAPDADVEREWLFFCEQHEMILWDESIKIQGLLPRILLIFEMIRFQKDFSHGADVKESLSKILNHAKMMKKEEVVQHFSSKQRMDQMRKILENKTVEHFDQMRKRKLV